MRSSWNLAFFIRNIKHVFLYFLSFDLSFWPIWPFYQWGALLISINIHYFRLIILSFSILNNVIHPEDIYYLVPQKDISYLTAIPVLADTNFQIHIYLYNRWDASISLWRVTNYSCWFNNWLTARPWPTGAWWSYPILIGHMDTRQAYFIWVHHIENKLMFTDPMDLCADEINEISKAPKPCCDSQMEGSLCNNEMCHNCTAQQENQSRYVRGTILVKEPYMLGITDPNMV
jgi:hypothetical protein